MGSDYLFLMVDAAITVLTEDSLRTLVKGFLNPDELQADGKEEMRLLENVKAFRKASLQGNYYEDFAVNSKNCSTTSGGTLAWMADCRFMGAGNRMGESLAGMVHGSCGRGYGRRVRDKSSCCSEPTLQLRSWPATRHGLPGRHAVTAASPARERADAVRNGGCLHCSEVG